MIDIEVVLSQEPTRVIGTQSGKDLYLAEAFELTKVSVKQALHGTSSEVMRDKSTTEVCYPALPIHLAHRDAAISKNLLRHHSRHLR